MSSSTELYDIIHQTVLERFRDNHSIFIPKLIQEMYCEKHCEKWNPRKEVDQYGMKYCSNFIWARSVGTRVNCLNFITYDKAHLFEGAELFD